jgi:hypothetical protein
MAAMLLREKAGLLLLASVLKNFKQEMDTNYTQSFAQSCGLKVALSRDVVGLTFPRLALGAHLDLRLFLLSVLATDFFFGVCNAHNAWA